MEIRFLEKEGEKLSFLVKDTTPAFANLLRDAMMNKVPTLAIEDVEFRKNNTILYDEIIAHRFGLIPIKTDLKSYDLPEECTCKGKGCAKCTLKMTLTANNVGYVYSSKIKSKDPKAVPIDQRIPIVKLQKGQGIQLEATAVLGIGKNHAKWVPCLAYYKYKPNLEIVKDPENPAKIAEACPVSVLKVKNNKLVIDKDNLLKCHNCDACVEISDGALKLEESDKDFVFYVESWGQLECREIVLKATDILQKQFEEFAKKLKK